MSLPLILTGVSRLFGRQCETSVGVGIKRPGSEDGLCLSIWSVFSSVQEGCSQGAVFFIELLVFSSNVVIVWFGLGWVFWCYLVCKIVTTSKYPMFQNIVLLENYM